MKKKTSNEILKSHNVYYADEQWRLRLYRKDHKIYEKQIHIPKLSFFSLDEEVLTVLRLFADKIGTASNKKDALQYFNEEIINKLNRAYFIGNMLEILRSAKND